MSDCDSRLGIVCDERGGGGTCRGSCDAVDVDVGCRTVDEGGGTYWRRRGLPDLSMWKLLTSTREEEPVELERGNGKPDGRRSAPEREEETLKREEEGGDDGKGGGRRRRWKGEIGAGEGGGDAGKGRGRRKRPKGERKEETPERGEGRSAPERERGDEGWPGAGAGRGPRAGKGKMRSGEGFFFFFLIPTNRAVVDRTAPFPVHGRTVRPVFEGLGQETATTAPLFHSQGATVGSSGILTTRPDCPQPSPVIGSRFPPRKPRSPIKTLKCVNFRGFGSGDGLRLRLFLSSTPKGRPRRTRLIRPLDGSFGKRRNKTHTLCVRCGRRSFHLQKSRCGSCGYPSSRIRKYNWSVKAIRRKTTGTGRMRYLRHVPRRFKSNFREEIWIKLVAIFGINPFFYSVASKTPIFALLGTQAAPRKTTAA
ncbi:hypothetical protein ACLOJK_011244 [Asimina triloba]